VLVSFLWIFFFFRPIDGLAGWLADWPWCGFMGVWGAFGVTFMQYPHRLRDMAFWDGRTD